MVLVKLMRLTNPNSSKIKLDPAFILKIEQLEQKNTKIHKKRLY